MTRPQVAILASGNGSTFRVTAQAVHNKEVGYDIALLITDREDAGVLRQVEEVNSLYGLSIQPIIINSQRYPAGSQQRGQTLEEASEMCRQLREHKIDHVTLMGFMRILGKQVVKEYGWEPQYAFDDPVNNGKYRARLTNTHPGILPATSDTYGIHTQQRVLDLGLKQTAHTFHVVSVGVDEGPIITENKVAVLPNDTPESLFKRVQAVEKQHLPYDLDEFLKQQQEYLEERRAS